MSYVICEIFFLAKDATKAFEMQHHSDEARELMKSFYVGQYLDVRTMQTFIIAFQICWFNPSIRWRCYRFIDDFQAYICQWPLSFQAEKDIVQTSEGFIYNDL